MMRLWENRNVIKYKYRVEFEGSIAVFHLNIIITII